MASKKDSQFRNFPINVCGEELKALKVHYKRIFIKLTSIWMMISRYTFLCCISTKYVLYIYLKIYVNVHIGVNIWICATLHLYKTPGK